MLSTKIKSVVAALALVLVNNVFANSLDLPEQKSSTSKFVDSNDKGFIYPASYLDSSDFVETGVLFVYSDHILEYFNGDSEQLLSFINNSINYNNQAFINSNIPIKRVVSGLIYVEQDEIWTENDAYTDRLHALAKWRDATKGAALKEATQYSYLVSLAGYQKMATEATMLGQAFMGDNVSWISPYSKDADGWLDRTLSHELGHNDGFKHSNEEFPEGGSHIARHDAAGRKCGSHGSIMHVLGARTEPFFSDTQIKLVENQEEVCGSLGEANSAQVYRDLMQNNFANSEGTFKNITATREKTGVVSIHNNVNTVLEGTQLQFDIIFEGAEKGDSINYITRQGTAGLDDFASTIGSIVHNGVDNVYTVSVQTHVDTLVENPETLILELIYPNGVTLDANTATTQASIVDFSENTGFAQFAVTNMSVTEGDIAEITINRMDSAVGSVTINLATILGSASSSDFTAIDQEITFKDGEKAHTVFVQTQSDSVAEQSEYFTLQITQSLDPIYNGNQPLINSLITVTINEPAATKLSNNTANSVAQTNTVSNLPSSTSSSNSEASGGAVGISVFLLILVIAFRRNTIF